MKILKTPDDAIAGLAGHPFAPNRESVSDGEGGRLEVHFVDEGESSARPVVFPHGNPSWSFIWRRQIPLVRELGLRALAPDRVGMGLSDKPSALEDWLRAI